ncbi:retinol dehydrogenase 12-like isoform X2 [Uranotaenia lowii]|uniref:retinol dehydrogenase 12-like isoform X2 n=1 Tax=Uranotaenia lowii TaxID=190385 RepID=UPI00247A2516|nr:retinol dehydrogenase 12-like isoform X2 [Uranotaenia lowii]XP_055609936.1 retinol dehydrogenase 12-like isoform X2 [Uranotaenia lowii]
MTSLAYLLIPAGVGLGIYLIRKLRELQWGWVRSRDSLRGKFLIITGCNTGLGYETAKALVSRQASVIMACRNLDKANHAIEEIRKETKEGMLIPMELDLASFDSIRKFAAEIKAQYPTFDCLINNAGLAVQTPQYTKENYEVHCGVNHLGHFLLVDLLKENIKNNSARIVIVSSKMHEKKTSIDFDNFGKWVDRPRGERLNILYGNSKLMNFYFGRELYKKGYDVHVLCPGLCNTDFFRDYNPKWYHYVLFSPIVLLFLRSSKQGAQNIVHCATDNVNTVDKNPSTGYFVTNLQQTKSKFKFDDATSEQLWMESARQVALHPAK